MQFDVQGTIPFPEGPSLPMTVRRLCCCFVPRILAVSVVLTVLDLAVLGLVSGSLSAEERPKIVIPHHQSQPPGPPLSPAEAQKKMTVPDGFTVELVASEPQIVNPVAMCFDERGRVWITESLEYPRRSAGPGKDRVKILEDTNGDGKTDKVTVFAEGLNIPSGIAVGHGGVWVANSPDILFLQDTDGDDKADKREVVVSGFGRTDTHELPNSLTWGPDGWLYGLNGVFNHSHVKHRGQEYRFTCAMFRIHPQTRQFELFAEGTSNPWGIAWDHLGSAFISACVIDHLWHITESGYYIRQGGPYPPFTRPMHSIVKHKHQKAAYCGITLFDSPAYPEQYRGKLYMGNIHGGCINCDALRRDGSSYFATPRDDFLTANDAWFMPVVQKTGPDGCLYVLDWYDRYHCYQDANRDPQGIDRLRGRLWRIRYQNTPRRSGFNLAQLDSDRLIELLQSPNVYDRQIAGRLLFERLSGSSSEASVEAKTQLTEKLEQLVLFRAVAQKYRLPALWVLVSVGLREATLDRLLADSEPPLVAWAVRAAGNAGQVHSEKTLQKIAGLAKHPSADVRLQVAIAAKKIQSLDTLAVLAEVLAEAGDDKLIPHIVWQNLHPLLETQAHEFLTALQKRKLLDKPPVAAMMPQVVKRILATGSGDVTPVVSLVTVLLNSPTAGSSIKQQSLAALAARVQTGEVNAQQRQQLREKLSPVLQPILAGPTNHPLHLDAMLLAATWRDPAAFQAATRVFANQAAPEDRRIQALKAVISGGGKNRGAQKLLKPVAEALADRGRGSIGFRSQVLAALGGLPDSAVATTVLQQYPQMEPGLKPKAIELLTSRSAWAKPLLEEVAAGRVAASALNVNQIRKLLSSRDPELVAAVKKRWGSIRTDRNPQREQVLTEMRQLIRSTKGDPHAGVKVYTKLCAQCHKFHGRGYEVGPEITRNGRASFDQLLSNVFDPSLVIGASYQARTVLTDDGRVITGLLEEDNDRRVVLKVQGGKREVVPRSSIDEMAVSKLSLMPEGIEKQLSKQEIADLFAYLVLDRPPTEPDAQALWPLSPQPQQTNDPKQFASLISQVVPGFTTTAVGEGGVAILADYHGRSGVLRTHPVDRRKPCVLSRTVTIPPSAHAKLLVSVAPHQSGDWRLIVRGNGQQLHSQIVRRGRGGRFWQDIEVDLSPLAGQTVRLELINAANNWSYEFAFWGSAQVFID